MVEILAGGHFERAVQALDLTTAVCAYHYVPPKGSPREEYQVWELSDEDFSNLCSINEKDWENGWGWWRHAQGANLGAVNAEFTIHREKLQAWDGYTRIHLCDDCEDLESGSCLGADYDKKVCYNSRGYSDILTYLCDEIGASTEKNVCACAIELAKQNSMKLSELFKKYLG